MKRQREFLELCNMQYAICYTMTMTMIFLPIYQLFPFVLDVGSAF